MTAAVKKKTAIQVNAVNVGRLLKIISQWDYSGGSVSQEMIDAKSKPGLKLGAKNDQIKLNLLTLFCFFLVCFL